MAAEQMGLGQRQPSGLGQQILESQQLYDLLVTKISDLAVERMEAQQNRARNRTAIFLTLFIASLTGIATFGFNALQESIKDQAVTEAKRAAAEAANEAVVAAREAATEAAARAVPKEVADAVQDQVDAAQRAWTRLSEATELAALSRRDEERESFSQEEANRALDLLTRLGEDGAYKSIPQFEMLLEQIIDIFQAADRDDLMTRLEPIYLDLMLNQVGIVYTMVESLGRMLVAFPVMPNQLGNSRMRAEWDALLKRYDQYAAAARRHAFPEWPYPYDLLITTMEGNPNVIIEARLSDLRELSEDEKESVARTLVSLGSASWRKNGPDTFATLVMERTIYLLEHYSNQDGTGILKRALSEIKYEEAMADSGTVDDGGASSRRSPAMMLLNQAARRSKPDRKRRTEAPALRCDPARSAPPSAGERRARGFASVGRVPDPARRRDQQPSASASACSISRAPPSTSAANWS